MCDEGLCVWAVCARGARAAIVAATGSGSGSTGSRDAPLRELCRCVRKGQEASPSVAHRDVVEDVVEDSSPFSPAARPPGVHGSRDPAAPVSHKSK